MARSPRQHLVRAAGRLLHREQFPLVNRGASTRACRVHTLVNAVKESMNRPRLAIHVIHQQILPEIIRSGEVCLAPA